jgi:hypothetical protein
MRRPVDSRFRKVDASHAAESIASDRRLQHLVESFDNCAE